MTDDTGRPFRLRLGDAVLDLDALALSDRDHRPIPLRDKSFRVLIELAKGNGRTVDKDTLFSAAWPGRTVSDDCLVQCVKDIRSAIGDRDRQLLRTTVGRGYCLRGIAERDIGPGERPRLLISPLRAPNDATEASDLATLVTEELILALSPRAGFEVTTDEAQRGSAQYEVRGRVAARDGSLRVFMQFGSLETAEIVFAETWTAPMTERGLLPARIAEKMASIARIHLFNFAGKAHLHRDNADLTIQQLLSKAAYHMSRIEMSNREIAREALSVAIERDPGNPMALAMRASVAVILVLQQGLSSVPDPAHYCLDLAERAVMIAPHVDFVMLTRGCLRLWLNADHVGAQADFQRALDVSPVFHLAHQFMAVSEILSGRAASGVQRVEKIIELGTMANPRYPHYLALLSLGRLLCGDEEGAVNAGLEAHERAPGDPWCAYVYAAAADGGGAPPRSEAFHQMIARNPLPFAHFRGLPFTDPRDVEMLEERLSRAGYPRGR